MQLQRIFCNIEIDDDVYSKVIQQLQDTLKNDKKKVKTTFSDWSEKNQTQETKPKNDWTKIFQTTEPTSHYQCCRVVDVFLNSLLLYAEVALCKPKEILTCGPNCENTCQNYKTNPRNLTCFNNWNCSTERTCSCDEGYVRKGTDCIKTSQCLKSKPIFQKLHNQQKIVCIKEGKPKCESSKEEYHPCGELCEKSCNKVKSSMSKKKCQRKQCKNSKGKCICKKNFVRNSSNLVAPKCIHENQCPKGNNIACSYCWSQLPLALCN